MQDICLPSVDAWVSRQDVGRQGTEAMSGIIYLRPVHTRVVRAENSNLSAESGSRKQCRVATGSLGCTESNCPRLRNTRELREGRAGVGRVENTLIRRNPDIASDTWVDYDLERRSGRAKGAWARECLSTISGDVEFGSRSAVKDSVVQLIRCDLRIRGKGGYCCESIGIL